MPGQAAEPAVQAQPGNQQADHDQERSGEALQVSLSLYIGAYSKAPCIRGQQY